MAENFPGPYQVRLNYVCEGRPHQQRLNCNISGTPAPGLPFSSYNVVQQNTFAIPLNTAVDNWVTLIRPFFNNVNANIVDAELWKYTAGTNVATFHAIYTIGLLGTAASPTVHASQGRLSLRTTEGGTMFVDFMDTFKQAGTYDPAPIGDTQAAAVATFLVGATNWVLGKDTSYPISARAWYPGINEAWFKKIYRP